MSSYDRNLPIIINAGWINAMGLIRSFAIDSIPSISISKEFFGLPLFSSQTIGLHFPDSQDSPEKLKECLLLLAGQLKRPGIIFPTDDLTLEHLIAIDEKINQFFIRTYPKADVLDFIMDKYNQYLSAIKAGVPVPYTMAPLKISDLEEWPDHLFPCVVKGRRGKRFYNATGFQAFLARNPEELKKRFNKVKNEGVIVQEYVPGEDINLFGYSSYLTESGEVLAEFKSQKLEQIPRILGVMRRGMSNSKPAIERQSINWLKSIHYSGFSYIEYKLDERDKKYKLIELNARSWLNQFMATLSGINFPGLVYDFLTNEEKPVIRNQLDGIEWVSRSEEFFYMIGDLIRGRFNLRDLLKNRPIGKDVLFGWKDPLPGLIVPFYLVESYINNRVKISKLTIRSV